MENRNFDILEIAKQFVHAIEEGKTGEELNEFYDGDILQTEYPNALTKNLTTRDLNELKVSSLKGQKVISRQTFEIINSFVSGNTVILEVVWNGTLLIPIGKMPSGGQMKAYFAQFFEFSNGKIIRQRNYDCFEPFLD